MHADLPIDARAAAILADQQLRFELVDSNDTERLGSWLQAEQRGFYGPPMSDKTLSEFVAGVAYRRRSGVWDDSGAQAHFPIATVDSWATPLTVPGERSIDGWAISAVTVASTHRRRGIARQLLESELRAAVALDVPLAMLTVSESTIYGRFGFGAATFAADIEVDARKARWTGATARGRTHFASTAQLRDDAVALIETVRLTTPGEIATWPHLWDRTFGISTDDSDLAKKLRGIRYLDENGELHGVLLYSMEPHERDFSRHTARVHSLIAATDDAYSALWSHLLELDLTERIVAPLRPVDEPLRWLVSDQRAVRTVDVRDHLWLRILDVPAVLSARSYSAPLSTTFEISDDLGFTTGRYLVNISSGQATVTRTEDAAALALSINDLSSLFLGGVSAVTLARAGRVAELEPGAAAGVDSSFRSPRVPHLPIWF